MPERSARVPRLALAGAVVGVLALGAAVAVVVIAAGRARKPPGRCTPGLEERDARCCAPGQRESEGRCAGPPVDCPLPLRATEGGCVAPSEAVFVSAGRVVVGPTDWDVASEPRKTLAVRGFFLDRFEVTNARYDACVVARDCPAVLGEAGAREPGVPVVGLGAPAAARFCAFAGGRLPTAAEWMFAAMGAEGRRYPWGPHGLLCRRSSYGLVSGPCAVGGTSPELAGARSEGRTPTGLFDLSGNVREWALEEARATTFGGSYRSQGASALKSFSRSDSVEELSDVGFRCAYDAERRTPTRGVRLIR